MGGMHPPGAYPLKPVSARIPTSTCSPTRWGPGRLPTPRRLTHLAAENAELKRSHTREVAVLRRQLAEATAGLAERDEEAVEQAAVYQSVYGASNPARPTWRWAGACLTCKRPGAARQHPAGARSWSGSSRKAARRREGCWRSAIRPWPNGEPSNGFVECLDSPVYRAAGSDDCAGCSPRP